jgi:hypothetical protein
MGAVKVLLGLLMVALVAVLPASASSAVRFVFDRAEATPHTQIRAKTAGKGALLRVRKRVLRAYFESDSLLPLGRVSVNRRGNGTLLVDVPNVPPGDYRVVLKGMPGSPRLTSARFGSSTGLRCGRARSPCGAGFPRLNRALPPGRPGLLRSRPSGGIESVVVAVRPRSIHRPIRREGASNDRAWTPGHPLRRP